MSAQRLRDAAMKLREVHAEASSKREPTDADIESLRPVDFAAIFITPDVALALADWLGAEADHDDRWEQARAAVTEEMWAFEGSTMPQALALAGTILGATR